jgi:phosphoenolpyruvate-protein kinase (PTS system EI component)
MQVGGYHSHGAIVAREYGIPAVVNVTGLLDHVREEQDITVDGDAGLVLVRARDADDQRSENAYASAGEQASSARAYTSQTL